MRAFMLFLIFSCSFSARCACLISSKVTYADNLSLGLLSLREAYNVSTVAGKFALAAPILKLILYAEACAGFSRVSLKATRISTRTMQPSHLLEDRRRVHCTIYVAQQDHILSSDHVEAHFLLCIQFSYHYPLHGSLKHQVSKLVK